MINNLSFLLYKSKNTERFILFNENTPMWLLLNSTAFEIVNLLKTYVNIDKVKEIISDKYSLDQDHALKDVLYVHNMLKKNNFYIKKDFKRKPSLTSVFINLTTRCNQKCPHCYIASEKNKKIDFPANKIINIIDELYENNGKSITLSGGEPLLHPDIKKIIKYASSKLNIRLLTNGTLIDRDYANFLSDNNVSVQISIDGSNEKIHDSIRGKGSFNLSINAIKHLKKAGFEDNLNLCTTIMKQNHNDIIDIIDLSQNYNIQMLRFLHLRRTGRADRKWADISGMNLNDYENFIIKILELQKYYKTNLTLTCGMSGFLLKIPKEFDEDGLWCPVGKMLIIDTSGNAYPCVLMMSDKYLMGNVFKEGLAKIFQSDKMLNLCDYFSNRRLLISKCSKCTFRNLCQSGCMGQAIDHNGSIEKTDNFCNLRKTLYQNAFNEIITFNNE